MMKIAASLLLLFGLFGLRRAARGALCPEKCTCDDQSLTFDCTSSDLEGIPHFLHPDMKVFKAKNNQIGKLEGTLGFYGNLQILDLSGNKFSHLGRLQFLGSEKLELLNISNNFVASLHATETFQGPKAIQTLDLSRNILTSLANGTFSPLETLIDLRLSRNKINSVEPMAFAGLASLRWLYLDHNLLSFIDPQWFEPLKNLRFLFLANNMIRALPAFTFRPLKALQIIDLATNKLHNISEDAFYGARAVDTLHLSDNLLSEVPSVALSSMENLASLDLSQNPVKALNRVSFSTMYVLKTLKLDRMYQLASLDVLTFVDNVQLRHLSLSNNHELQALPWGIFSANTGLSEVNFANNSRWTSLFPTQVPIRSIQSLQVSGIPFYCNCSLTWLWELYQQNDSDYYLDVATCQSVSNSAQRSVPLKEVAVDDLACADWGFVLIVASISILVTVITLVLVSFLAYNCKQKYSKHYAASPCLHIKDDTMVYTRAGNVNGGAYNYHHNPLDPDNESSTYAKAILGGYSPPTLEPFYEVPRLVASSGDSEEQPNKSSSTGSSKYSSSGYVGSELWENDFLGMNSGTPTQIHFNTQRSPRSSSGLGSNSGSSSTASSNGNRPVFFSPARNFGGHHPHHTLMTQCSSATNSPAKMFQVQQQQHPMFMMATSSSTGSPKFSPQQHHLVAINGTNGGRSPKQRAAGIANNFYV